ncbi:hypothetical protein [Streptomyces sp. NPDC086766]|uniref:hypothetical protein n=1 Tax=Streptomyces sp. NPDC086766 TaxID=3365754 RepID=UPI00380999EC
MTVRLRYRTAAASVITHVSLAGTVAGERPAQAAADRVRLGSTSDVSRSDWNGPACTMNGDGADVRASMRRAVDSIRDHPGSLDVVVLAGSAPRPAAEPLSATASCP